LYNDDVYLNITMKGNNEGEYNIRSLYGTPTLLIIYGGAMYENEETSG
jgi:hypothetical protein